MKDKFSLERLQGCSSKISLILDSLNYIFGYSVSPFQIPLIKNLGEIKIIIDDIIKKEKT